MMESMTELWQYARADRARMARLLVIAATVLVSAGAYTAALVLVVTA